MSLKTFVFIFFLVLVELCVEIKGGNENNNLHVQNTLEWHPVSFESLGRYVDETVSNLNYVIAHWYEILFVEQKEVTRLRGQLEVVLKKLHPNDYNSKIPLSIEEILRNKDTVIPVLKELGNYLIYVKANHAAPRTEYHNSNVQYQAITQELLLLSEISAGVHLKLDYIYENRDKIPYAVYGSLTQRQKHLEDIVKSIDSKMPRRFPTREELIKNRNMIMPVLLEFCYFLNNLEIKYLQRGSASGQKVQTGQMGQDLQARLEGQAKQGKQVGLGSQEVQTGYGGQGKQVGQSVSGVQYTQEWQTNPAGVQRVQGWPAGQSGQAVQGGQGQQTLPGGQTGLGGQFRQEWQTGQLQGWQAGQGGQKVAYQEEQRVTRGQAGLAGQFRQEYQAGQVWQAGQSVQGWQTNYVGLAGQGGQVGQGGQTGVSGQRVQGWQTGQKG